eukprot:m.251539 g.251539  ORF g.251539 m.251539 type:complete len:293 (+) comp16149_c0_seq12:3833-4711(+)
MADPAVVCQTIPPPPAIESETKAAGKIRIAFKCPWPDCERIFQSKSKFESHYRIHTGERPFVCEVCKAAFHQKSTLTRHMKIHDKKTPKKGKRGNEDQAMFPFPFFPFPMGNVPSDKETGDGDEGKDGANVEGMFPFPFPGMFAMQNAIKDGEKDKSKDKDGSEAKAEAHPMMPFFTGMLGNLAEANKAKDNGEKSENSKEDMLKAAFAAQGSDDNPVSEEAVAAMQQYVETYMQQLQAFMGAVYQQQQEVMKQAQELAKEAAAQEGEKDEKEKDLSAEDNARKAKKAKTQQ